MNAFFKKIQKQRPEEKLSENVQRRKQVAASVTLQHWKLTPGFQKKIGKGYFFFFLSHLVHRLPIYVCLMFLSLLNRGYGFSGEKAVEAKRRFHHVISRVHPLVMSHH